LPQRGERAKTRLEHSLLEGKKLLLQKLRELRFSRMNTDEFMHPGQHSNRPDGLQEPLHVKFLLEDWGR